jgi:iron complex outermembrane recepter protein
VRSFEGGLRYGSGDKILASLAVFHTRLSDDLVFDETVGRNEGTKPTERTGFALDFTMRPRSWLVHTGSVTYTRASFTGSNVLVPYAPQLVARSDMALAPRLARVLGRELKGRLGAGLTFLAVRPLPNAEFGHEIFLADITLGLGLKEIELEFDIFNLLNAKWYDGEFTYASNFTQGAAPSLVPLRHVSAGAPLTITGTLSIHL